MADRYFVGAGNWSDTGKWSLTDGGTTGEAVPTSSDAVFFTTNSGNCDVNTSARVCASLNFTGYASTITMSQQITVSGSITLVAAMTIAGTSALVCNSTSTLTSNGKTWPNSLTLSGTSITHTLADSWDVNGNLVLGSATALTVNGAFNITVAGNLSLGAAIPVGGTATVVMDGTGSVATTGAGSIRLNLTINTAGTITFSGTVNYSSNTLTYTAGTVVTTGTTLVSSLNVTTTVFATNGISWEAVTFAPAGTATITFSNTFTANGLLTVVSTSNILTLTGSNINANAGLRHNGTTGRTDGTTTITLTGTGTIDGPSITTGRIENTLIINAPGGTITFSATLCPYLELGDMTYTAGSLVIDGTTFTAGAGGTTIAGTPMRRGMV